MLSYENGLVSLLVCIMCAIQSMEVRRCCEISHLYVVKALSKLKKCDLFLIVHQCDVKVCKPNLVVDGNFCNNMECCMTKESGYIEYDSLPGQIRTGCIRTPKLARRFCEEHVRDHKELDKVGIQ